MSPQRDRYFLFYVLYIRINRTIYSEFKNMITIDRLRYFIAAAKLAHVGQASKKMNVSPSVISSAIKDLEDSIGERLFIRANNRVKLNGKGLELSKYVQRILDDINRLQDGSWQHSESQLAGHFKIGGSHFLVQEFLIPAALAVQKSIPKVTMEFVSLDSGVAMSQVKSGLLDAALVFRSSYFEAFNEIVCHEDKFKFYVKRNHPVLRVTRSKMVESLNGLPAVTFRTTGGANFWEQHPAFQKIGIEPIHTFFYDDTESCIQLLTKTSGWAFLPSVIGKRRREIAELPISNDFLAPVNISLLAADRPAAATLKEMLQKSLDGRWD